MKTVKLRKDERLDVYARLCKEHGLRPDIRKAKAFLVKTRLSPEQVVERLKCVLPLYKEVAPKLGYSTRFADISVIEDKGVWVYINNANTDENTIQHKTIPIQAYDPTVLNWVISCIMSDQTEKLIEYISKKGKVGLFTVLKGYEVLRRKPHAPIRRLIDDSGE